jgi:hypothetical protein
MAVLGLHRVENYDPEKESTPADFARALGGSEWTARKMLLDALRGGMLTRRRVKIDGKAVWAYRVGE